MLSLDKKYTYTETNDGGIFYPLDDYTSQGIVMLNSSASWICEMVQQGSPVQEIVQEFGCRYGVESNVATEDVNCCIAELVNLGVLRREGADE